MGTNPQISASQMEEIEVLDQAWVLSCLPRYWSESKKREIFQTLSSPLPAEFREDMGALDVAVFNALGSLRKGDSNQLHPLTAKAKASIAMWVGLEEVPQELEKRFLEAWSQRSKEEEDLIARYPTERKLFTQQNPVELVKQISEDLVRKLGEHKWPHEQTNGWVIRHLRGRFPNIARRSQSETAKAILLELQAFRFKNPNAIEDLILRVDIADIAPCIPWIVEAPGTQLNIRRARVIGNDLKSNSKLPYTTYNPFLLTMQTPPHQGPIINPKTSLRSAQKHMIPLHDYLTRNTETPVSQALHPITIARQTHCPTTLKIHAITLIILPHKLLSETILIGLTETSVSITTPSYIAINIERHRKHTRTHEFSLTQLTATIQPSKQQTTKTSPISSQTHMIPLHDYPTRHTETPVSYKSLNGPITHPILINTTHTYTFVLPTLNISCSIEPHGVTQLI
jgi:hypothetical protein